MRTMTHGTARLLSGLALMAGILLGLSAPARAQTITAEPQTVIIAKDAAQGATTITWDAGAGIKNLGAILWQQIDGGRETLVAAKAKGSQSILISAGETRVFKLRSFIKSKVLASVTVTATEQGAVPDENSKAGGAPAVKDAPDDVAAVSFTGTWETITNSQHHFALIMVQTGAKVTGTYPRGNGKIEGTVSGRVLRFKWESDGGTGSGRFVMDESAQAFSGTYNRGDNPEDVDATWNGKRPAVSPDEAPETGDKAPGTEDKAPEKVTPPNFAGVWRGRFGEAFMELILQQDGNQVAGQLRVNSADLGIISEGIVDGNTLRFKIMGVDKKKVLPKPKYVGSGELVMDEGGKSFTGNVLGAATSGNLVAR